MSDYKKCDRCDGTGRIVVSSALGVTKDCPQCDGKGGYHQ